MTNKEHLEVLNELFTRLKEANLTARPSKCAIAYPNLEYYWHGQIETTNKEGKSYIRSKTKTNKKRTQKDRQDHFWV